MPIYEYRCTNCGFEKEYLQKVSDPPVTQCPNCGQSAMTKKLTAAGFQLKGTGWYATDFKHGSGSKPAPSSKSNGGEGGGKTDGKPPAEGGDKGAEAKSSDAKPSAGTSGDGAAKTGGGTSTGTKPG